MWLWLLGNMSAGNFFDKVSTCMLLFGQIWDLPYMRSNRALLIYIVHTLIRVAVLCVLVRCGCARGNLGCWRPPSAIRCHSCFFMDTENLLSIIYPSFVVYAILLKIFPPVIHSKYVYNLSFKIIVQWYRIFSYKSHYVWALTVSLDCMQNTSLTISILTKYSGCETRTCTDLKFSHFPLRWRRWLNFLFLYS